MDQHVPQQSQYNPMSAAPQVSLPYQQPVGPVAGGYPSQVRLPQNMTFQQQQLHSFWNQQMQEIEQANDFKNHQLPLARIKKIMKADEDVRMISAEAPVVFAKACELFILELTLRSWIHTEENKRRTLQRSDIAAAITRTDIFDFLVDIVPRDELKEEGLGVARGNLPVGNPADTLPYGGMYYMPSSQPGLASPVAQPSGQSMAGISVGRPAGHVDPSAYMPLQHQRPGGMPYFAHQQAWQAQLESPDTTGGAPPPTSG